MSWKLLLSSIIMVDGKLIYSSSYQVNMPQRPISSMYYLLLSIMQMFTPKRVKLVFLEISNTTNCIKCPKIKRLFKKKARYDNFGKIVRVIGFMNCYLSPLGAMHILHNGRGWVVEIFVILRY